VLEKHQEPDAVLLQNDYAIISVKWGGGGSYTCLDPAGLEVDGQSVLCSHIDRFASQSLSTSSARIQTAATARDAALSAYHKSYTQESVHAYDKTQRELDNVCEAEKKGYADMYSFLAEKAVKTNDPGTAWIANQFKLEEEARIQEEQECAFLGTSTVVSIIDQTVHGSTLGRKQECQEALDIFMGSVQITDHGGKQDMRRVGHRSSRANKDLSH
jgi:hypothetical protein